MRLADKLGHRIRALFRKDIIEENLDDELRFHIERQIQENIARGIPAAEARRAALREFGGMEQMKEECRDTRQVNWVQDFWRDLRFAVRMLRKNPGFAAVAVITLALGIGANTAIFSVINTVLLQPLPYPEPKKLVTLKSNESLPDVEDLQTQTRSFAAIGGMTTQALDYTSEAEPLQVYAGLVNADFFKALAVKPEIGRVIAADEDRYGGERSIVLSDGFWRRHFAGDAGILGKSISLSGNSYVVIGVMPGDFWLPGRTVDVLASLRVVNPLAAKFRGVHFLRTYLRLNDTVSMAQAQGDVERASEWLAQHFPEENAGRRRTLIPLQERLVGDVRPALLILLAAVGLVLLIACVNFANLLLTRAAHRQRELVIRSAMGAGQSRLIRQALTESCVLALLGGSVGLALGELGTRIIILLSPATVPRLTAIRMDGWVLGFAFCLSIATGVLFGLLPALRIARQNISDRLKATSRSSSEDAEGLRVRRVLVGAEVALALILLIGAGLLIRSFWMLQSVPPGFVPENLLTMRVELPEARYGDLSKQRQFRERLLDSLNESPGVHVAMISEIPMSGDFITHNFVIGGRPAIKSGEEPEVNTRTVGGEYFRTMGIAIRSGRDFTGVDRSGSEHVAIVNEAFVRQYLGKQNVIGEHIAWAREKPLDWMTIVGVAADVKHFGPNEPEQPAVYDLYSQTMQVWKRWMYLVVRGDRSDSSMIADVKARLWAVDPQIPPTEVRSMEEIMASAVNGQRFNLTLLTVFAVVALILASVGIYGVMSYTVAQRTQEIGLRKALGAQDWNLLRMVFGESARVVVAGGLIGVLVALALSRLMAGLLFGIRAQDPATFLGVAGILAVVSFLACYVPARRAMRVDPMVALRDE